jgi:hypothetical protein
MTESEAIQYYSELYFKYEDFRNKANWWRRLGRVRTSSVHLF